MPYKILVVDDNDAARSGLTSLLRASGYEPIAAATLPDAERLLAQNRPDLVIVDVRLGGDNGLQLVATASTSTPAIVLTGFPDATLAAEARLLGAEFLLKPVVAPGLLDVIRRRLPQAAPTPLTHHR
jgi:DNA-binding NtrC family response regulator